MHATLKRRVARLEERTVVDSQQRNIHRIEVTRLDRDPHPDNVECKRAFCPDGTIIEVFRRDR